MANVTVGSNSGMTLSTRSVVRTSNNWAVCGFQPGTSINISKGNQAGEPTTFILEDTTGNTPGLIEDKVCMAIDSIDDTHFIYYAENTGHSGVLELLYSVLDDSVDPEVLSPEDEQITVLDNQGTAHACDIAIDANDDAHVVWTERITDTGTDYDRLYYSNRIGGTWSTPVAIKTLAATGANILTVNIMIGSPHTSASGDRPIICEGELDGNTRDVFCHYGNTLDATSFTSQDLNIELSTGVLPQLTMVQDSNDRITIAFSDFTTLDLKIIEHNYSDGWSTWQTPITTFSSQNTRAPAMTLSGDYRYIFFLSSSTDDIHLVSDQSGSWAELTDDPDLSNVGTFTGINCRWSKYNYGQDTTLDYTFQDGNTVMWNTYTASPPVAGSRVEYIQGYIPQVLF